MLRICGREGWWSGGGGRIPAGRQLCVSDFEFPALVHKFSSRQFGSCESDSGLSSPYSSRIPSPGFASVSVHTSYPPHLKNHSFLCSRLMQKS
jgi:hypothetical protein